MLQTTNIFDNFLVRIVSNQLKFWMMCGANHLQFHVAVKLNEMNMSLRAINADNTQKETAKFVFVFLDRSIDRRLMNWYTLFIHRDWTRRSQLCCTENQWTAARTSCFFWMYSARFDYIFMLRCWYCRVSSELFNHC